MADFYIFCFPHETLSPVKFRELLSHIHPYVLDAKGNAIHTSSTL